MSTKSGQSHYRRFGRTGWQVSQITLGAWQLGADWGTVTEDEALPQEEAKEASVKPEAAARQEPMKESSSSQDSSPGRMFMESGPFLYLYAGPTGPTALHAHHAFQLVVTMGGTVSLRGEEGVPVQMQAAVIPPDAPHAFTAPVPDSLLLYVDPDGLTGRRLRARGGNARSARAWMQAGLPLLSSRPSALPRTWEEARQCAGRLLSALVGPTHQSQVLHPAVLRAVRYLREHLQGDVSLGTVAAHSGVSSSRLAHLFPSQLGIPLRPYVLWLRLQHATATLCEGGTLTEAAYLAGFADGAHLTRVFRRMFGIRPSDAKGRAEWMVPEPLEPSR